jgi:hypothetical protein
VLSVLFTPSILYSLVMTPTHPPMTFNGQIVNLQIVLGGNPTIHNYAHPPESPESARPMPHSSRPSPPPTSNSPRASESAARGHSRNPPSQSSYAAEAATIPFPLPRPEPSPSSSGLLSPIGSPMVNLNDLQTRILITHSLRQSNTVEDYAHLPSPALYIRSHAGDLRLRAHERVDSSLSQQDAYAANMYRSTQHVSFPTPRLSFPTPMNLHVWPMPGPDRFDWFVDEREEEDHLDDDDYH